MTYTHQPGRSEGFDLLVAGLLSFNFWAGEIFLGIVVPLIVLFFTRFRQQPVLRLSALIMVVGGVIAYRWDTNLVGQMIIQTPQTLWQEVNYVEYVPSLVEVSATLGILICTLICCGFTVNSGMLINK